ncbi:hypothetical protein R6Q57_020426 [Mikania cordata]
MSSENTQTDPAITAAINRAFTEQIPNIVETIMGRLNHNQNNLLPPPLYPPPHIPNPPPYDPETHTDNTISGIHEWLTRFQKQKPRSFSSAPDPMGACNWIMHIDKIFEVLGVEQKFKVLMGFEGCAK